MGRSSSLWKKTMIERSVVRLFVAIVAEAEETCVGSGKLHIPAK